MRVFGWVLRSRNERWRIAPGFAGVIRPTLTLYEVTTVENIVVVLAFTITQMAAIDTAYKLAFPEHS